MVQATYAYDDRQAQNLMHDDVIKLHNEDDTFAWWVVTGITKTGTVVDITVSEYGNHTIAPRELTFTIDHKAVFMTRKPR